MLLKEDMLLPLPNPKVLSEQYNQKMAFSTPSLPLITELITHLTPHSLPSHIRSSTFLIF